MNFDLSLFRPRIALRRRRDKIRLEVLQPARSRWTRAQVLYLPLTGLVSGGGTGALVSDHGMLVTLKDQLRVARGNKRLRAVVLRIDSPGGEVTASDLIYRELVEFKKAMGIPLVAWLGSTAASGGLYIAMAADEIYALPTTITGSIGVITMLPGLAGLGDKLGVEMRVIKSGPNKDLGSMWKPLGEEQRLIFQDLIDAMYVRFRQVVLEGRRAKGLTEEKLTELADGRVFDAATALAGNIIDGIRYPEDVVARAKELAGLEDFKLVSYEYDGHYRGHIYADSSASAPLAIESLAELLTGDPEILWSLCAQRGTLSGLDRGALGEVMRRPSFCYLWMP